MTKMYGDILCRDSGRRDAVLANTLNGIDAIEIMDQKILHVFFMKGIPGNLFPENISITGGERVRNIGIISILGGENPNPDPKIPLKITVDRTGDFSIYTLNIVSSQLDPMYSSASFSFKIQCPPLFDCKNEPSSTESTNTEPLIDYHVKDYAGFQRALLDWVSAQSPNWKENHSEADVGRALLELFSYTADQLSDQQDRIANEMYLSTARQRVSVKRHSALIDYYMHEGANAKTFLFFHVNRFGCLLAQTQVTTAAEVGKETIIFETDTQAALNPDHNEFEIYTWSNNECCLPIGSTQVCLVGKHPDLNPDDHILFEEVVSPSTGDPDDADETRRVVVKLVRVEATRDPLTGNDLTRITWREVDALEMDFCLSKRYDDGSVLSGLTVARGNIVSASHGESKIQIVNCPSNPRDESSRCNQKRLSSVAPFCFLLEGVPLTFIAGPNGVRDGRSSVRISAPPLGEWEEQRTLVESGPFSQHFVVDVDNNGHATIRFGDGVNGRAMLPGAVINVTYRVGNGSIGNVGARTLICLPSSTDFVDTVTNPLAAQGGTDPEPLCDVKRDAPVAFRATMLRAVTADDYVRAAETVPGVQHAAAQIQWTGSWNTVFVRIDPRGRAGLTTDLRQRVLNRLDEFRMAGYDMEVQPPVYVPLDIAIVVCVESDHYRAEVQRALYARLNAVTGGLFHPDNFSFGDPLYISKLYQAVEMVEGVRFAEVTRFGRWARREVGELERGVIAVSSSEVIRLDNDPSVQEHGRLILTMQGGK